MRKRHGGSLSERAIHRHVENPHRKLGGDSNVTVQREVSYHVEKT